MIAFLILSVGAGPTFTVTNKCPAPASFVVVNKCPAKIVKPVKVTNGFNCGAGFCGANGGQGCPSCPNGSGTCACGPKAAPAYVLPVSQSACPGGNCPPATTGYFRPGIFRRSP